MFTEPVEFGLLFDSKVFGDSSKQGDGDELAKTREKDDIVSEEEKITPAFGVTGIVGVGSGYKVGQKKYGTKWVGEMAIGKIRANERGQRLKEGLELGCEQFPVYVQDNWDEEQF